jgi:hypothetical protein
VGNLPKKNTKCQMPVGLPALRGVVETNDWCNIQTVHHILKNTAVQNVNKPFVYITDLTSTLNQILITKI